MTHKLLPPARRALRLLAVQPRYRTVRQWRALRAAFERWPRRIVALSGRTTWASCVRCRRHGPVAVIRSFCSSCAFGRPPLRESQVTEQHQWLVDGAKIVPMWSDSDARDWWKVPIEPVRDAPLVWVDIEARQ